MNSRSILRILLIVILVLLQAKFKILAQQESRLGLNISSNFNFYSQNFMPEIGFVFVRQITIHSSIEANLNFRIHQRQISVLVDDNSTMYPLINEKYITIPVSYKFYSKIINAGAGISFDYYLGWKQLSGSQEISSYWPGADYYIGLIGKISKQLTLDEKLILEPEVKFNILILPFERHYIGFGLVAKFVL
jgi:hypothetical protein